MPLGPARVADTLAWLEKAAIDLRSGRVDLDADPPILGDALFHCQQAVEKLPEGGTKEVKIVLKIAWLTFP